MCQVCIRHRHKVFIISPCIHQLMCVQGLGYTVMVGEILKLLIRHPSLAPDSLLYTTMYEVLSKASYPLLLILGDKY